MKTHFYVIGILLITLVLSACQTVSNSASSSSRTMISGKIDGGENKQLFINKIKGTRGQIIDTIQIGADGTFKHQLNQPLALDYYIVTNADRGQIQLITDSTEEIVLNASYSSLGEPSKLEGSKHSEVYLGLVNMVKTSNKKLNEMDKLISAAQTIEEKKEIGKSKKAERIALKQNLNSYIEDNALSPGIAALLNHVDITKEPELARSTINHMAKVVSSTSYYKTMAKQVKQYAIITSTSPDAGTVAPNIKLKDPDGVERTLNSLRGNVILIDFWASWCGPCRRENPNVVKAYNKYHSSGFDVMSVSLDNDKQKWINAIKADGLLWENHVSDLKKWDTPYKTLYNFTGIPHTVLVDREGVIIQSKIRGAALEEKLEDIFGF